MAEAVTVLDVTTRDGLQDEPVIVATAGKRKIIEALVAAGVRELEVTSFVHPKWVPQLADADVLIPDLPRSARYSALILNDKGFDRAVTAFTAGKYARGSFDLVFVASASPRHNRSNNNRSIAESLTYFDQIAARAKIEGVSLRAAVACAYASPWPDETIDLTTVCEMVERFERGGATMVSLADTIGKADPVTIRTTTRAVRSRSGVGLSLHLHDLRGSALANVDAALEVGVRRFEGVLSGIGGCPFAPDAPGNLDLSALVAHLDARGFTTGIDRRALAAAATSLAGALAAAERIPIRAAAHG